MDTSTRHIMGDITLCGKMSVLECVNHESVEERLLDYGKVSSSKRKVQDLDMLPQSPQKAKHKFCQYNEVQKIMGIDECNESDDVSTESDESLGEDYKMRGFIHDTASSFLHAHDFDSLALKENVADGTENMTQELLESTGFEKSCSCSFCLKAAHMWMDLTFQDTRGRLSELQKSRKRAIDQIAKFTQSFSRLSNSVKLEYDLMQNWKMIFVHTQDAIDHQITETRSDLLVRTRLMENCKRELESRTNFFSGERHNNV